MVTLVGAAHLGGCQHRCFYGAARQHGGQQPSIVTEEDAIKCSKDGSWTDPRTRIFSVFFRPPHCLRFATVQRHNLSGRSIRRLMTVDSATAGVLSSVSSVICDRGDVHVDDGARAAARMRACYYSNSMRIVVDCMRLSSPSPARREERTWAASYSPAVSSRTIASVWAILFHIRSRGGGALRRGEHGNPMMKRCAGSTSGSDGAD
eukprot:COSAG02_NODE_98_length_37150_cov_39.614207_9_plen_206_part_00